MEFMVTTSELTYKTFKLEAKNEEKARDFDSPYKELISVKTISWEIVDVEEIE